jgi:hypothetical protein
MVDHLHEEPGGDEDEREQPEEQADCCPAAVTLSQRPEPEGCSKDVEPLPEAPLEQGVGGIVVQSATVFAQCAIRKAFAVVPLSLEDCRGEWFEEMRIHRQA